LNGRVAAYGWAATKGEFPVREVRLKLPFGADEAVLYDFFVLPEFRGHRLYPKLLQSIRRHGPGRRQWIFAEAANRASVSGIQRAGFTYAFQLERRVLLGRNVRVVEAPPVAALPTLSGATGDP
jgi:GNAT superfamily N-acetyltransferase